MGVLEFGLLVVMVAALCWILSEGAKWFEAPAFLVKAIWGVGVIYLLYRAVGALSGAGLHF